jgi:hypothetical protein
MRNTAFHLVAGALMQNAERCMELLDREPGWLDGKGVPPTSEVL